MIGNLKPIKLYQYTEAIDANGDAIEEVANTYKMWAEVTDQGGTRGQALGRTAMSDSKEFRIYFRGYLVTGNYKIVYFGQTYAITNVQRVQEKRFNYILTGFATFEANVGTSANTPVNFEVIEYAQDTGILTFEQGNLGGAYLQVLFKNAATGLAYVNRFGESLSVGPGEFTELYYPLFTPNDVILVQWYLVSPDSPTPISPINELTITCNRLSNRSFRLYRYGVQNDRLQASIFQYGVYPYNVAGSQLPIVYNIADFINSMNADAVNSQYFQIIDYTLVTSGTFADSYLLECTSVDPYFQWNPGNTILYLEGAPA